MRVIGQNGTQCQYRGKVMEVNADGASKEVVLHCLTERKNVIFEVRLDEEDLETLTQFMTRL